jgi:DNA-binding Xre family transcriptional regulator
MKAPEIRFKRESVEELLEERKPGMEAVTYQQVKKTIDRGADGLDPYTLSNLCRDLKCLPTDIVEFS